MSESSIPEENRTPRNNSPEPAPKTQASGSSGGSPEQQPRFATTGGVTPSKPGQKADDPSTESESGVLYLGIDLGTSRTAIAGSNGGRSSVPSVVGYPKDVVAKKLLGRDILFGDDAFKKRLSLDFYRPLEHGVIKYSDGDDKASEKAENNRRAAADLVQEAIRMANPRSDELIYAVIGCPAQASLTNQKALIDAAKAVVDSVMICSEPFAVAYGLNRLDDVLVIDIGAGTTDLCRMKGTLPDAEDQLTLNLGGDSIDNLLTELIKKKCPGSQFTINMVKEIKERHSFVNQSQDPIKVELPVEGKPTLFEITDEVREACRSIIPPIVDAIRKLISTFDPEFQTVLKNNVLLGGGGSQIKGLATALQNEMIEKLGEGTVVAVEEPVYAGANGALQVAHDMPPSYWEKMK